MIALGEAAVAFRHEAKLKPQRLARETRSSATKLLHSRRSCTLRNSIYRRNWPFRVKGPVPVYRISYGNPISPGSGVHVAQRTTYLHTCIQTWLLQVSPRTFELHAGLRLGHALTPKLNLVAHIYRQLICGNESMQVLQGRGKASASYLRLRKC